MRLPRYADRPHTRTACPRHQIDDDAGPASSKVKGEPAAEEEEEEEGEEEGEEKVVGVQTDDGIA